MCVCVCEGINKLVKIGTAHINTTDPKTNTHTMTGSNISQHINWKNENIQLTGQDLSHPSSESLRDQFINIQTDIIAFLYHNPSLSSSICLLCPKVDLNLNKPEHIHTIGKCQIGRESFSFKTSFKKDTF